MLKPTSAWFLAFGTATLQFHSELDQNAVKKDQFSGTYKSKFNQS